MTPSFYRLLWKAGREAGESGQFQGLPEAILSCLPFCLKSFSTGGWRESSKMSVMIKFMSHVEPTICQLPPDKIAPLPREPW